ncbi:hypothetical protein Tco_1370646 [Tanacetum coccineum]
MEVFTLMLRIQVKNEKNFRYHWGCQELQILNLCFADDLMMFCCGYMISASVMRRVIDEFCLSSGLRPSMAKSTVYFGNVPNDVKEKIKNIMPFTEGTIPVKYLGIPLNFSMFTKSDCTVLLEKVKRRVEDWRNKALSFAGRLQLITSIDRLLKKFLWNVVGQNGCTHSVLWKDVCRQKSEGGLGIKSMQVWNEALMAKHLWNVIIDKDSIWVRWVKSTLLKGDSIWVVELKKINSWGWKQILTLRNKIRSFVHFKVRNGRKAFFWYDKWNERSPFCNLINYNTLLHDGQAMKMKIADLIVKDKWIWPRTWNRRFVEVLNIQVPKLLDAVDDKAVWNNNKGKEKNFNVKEVWKGMKRRLKTQDRLSRWINVQDMCCPFCKQGLNLKITKDVINALEVWRFPIDRIRVFGLTVLVLLQPVVETVLILVYGNVTRIFLTVLT